ncbi:hypothetical protein FJ970_22570 [Mesorhizobium sp. B2-1-8]|uniref:hypothetical protein n=1 Tax=Mesorhizobium sp. B2-1-8 TaxID=2589967 RepID=UPI001125E78B|nr:hypothetical protein [Mesorhizobium sp. B2-1-8]UCI17869.1 hypothetical protein FJ970_22570 [Mesorhizobium sp. B2-1-8]
MPQPVRQKLKGYSTGYRVVLDRRELCTQIGVITNMWSMIEHELQLIYLRMLGRNAKAARIIYNAVPSDPARLQIVKRVAKEVLEPDDVAQLDKLLTAISARKKERNLVVHGRWATSADFPDALLLIDEQDVMEREAQFIENRASDADGGPVVAVPDDKMRPMMVAYTAKCLGDIQARIVRDHSELHRWSEHIEEKLITKISSRRLDEILLAYFSGRESTAAD